MKTERKLFMELMTGDAIARRSAMCSSPSARSGKSPDVPDDTQTIPIAKVGVIGAGTMGGGIAMNFLNAGIPVTIVETKQDALDRGLATIRRNYENTAKSGRLTQADVEKRMGLLKRTLALDELADCDLVIEAVFENMDIKKEVFGKLDKIVKQGAILATNTSLSEYRRDRLGRPSGRSGDRLHFFSPANVMRLLEVVRGDKTSKPVIATSMQIARKIGKIAALVGVCPGFVGNRMLAQRQREAQKLILEGAMPWDVDRVLYDFGFPMGPFAMSRSRRPRHRLVEGDVEELDHPRNPVRDGPARAEDRRGLLRLRRGAQRDAVAGGREDRSSNSPPRRASTGARFRTRRSSSAASIR